MGGGWHYEGKKKLGAPDKIRARLWVGLLHNPDTGIGNMAFKSQTLETADRVINKVKNVRLNHKCAVHMFIYMLMLS